MSEIIKAYFFSDKNHCLRYGDGRKIYLGGTHSVKGSIKLCENGLHASENILDALRYAPSSHLYIVELSGDMDKGDNKIAAQHRTYIKYINAECILREFSRKQAIINIEKIKPHCKSLEDYKVIYDYLATGNESLRLAARLAAESAARAAAWSAAESAAWAARSAARAAESAARAAAWAAAGSAARAAAGSAARAAAESAARAAAGSAARAAAESAAWAARSAAESAARAAESAAWSAAESAARAAESAANQMLEDMIKEAIDAS